MSQKETATMTTHRRNLILILTVIQNSAKFENRDIMTFSGFMSDDELPKYVWDRFDLLPPIDKLRALETARAVMVTGR